MKIKNLSGSSQVVIVDGEEKTVEPYGEITVDDNSALYIKDTEHIQIKGEED